MCCCCCFFLYYLLVLCVREIEKNFRNVCNFCNDENLFSLSNKFVFTLFFLLLFAFFSRFCTFVVAVYVVIFYHSTHLQKFFPSFIFACYSHDVFTSLFLITFMVSHFNFFFELDLSQQCGLCRWKFCCCCCNSS